MMQMSASMPSLSSRPLKLVYNVYIMRIEKFWQGLKEGKIYTTKCKSCGELRFPPTADCPKCYSSDVEWVELSRDAELETFTHVVVKPSSFSDVPPYTVAVGRLKEGVKVLAWLVDADPADIKVGMEMKLAVRESPEGEPFYVFVPAEKRA